MEGTGVDADVGRDKPTLTPGFSVVDDDNPTLTPGFAVVDGDKSSLTPGFAAVDGDKSALTPGLVEELRSTLTLSCVDGGRAASVEILDAVGFSVLEVKGTGVDAGRFSIACRFAPHSPQNFFFSFRDFLQHDNVFDEAVTIFSLSLSSASCPSKQLLK